jgi:hypothetical protein
MSIKIYRPGELYNQRDKRGLLNVGRTHFYMVIEPQLERVALGKRATGYTGRSVREFIERSITKAAAYRRQAEVEVGVAV